MSHQGVNEDRDISDSHIAVQHHQQELHGSYQGVGRASTAIICVLFSRNHSTACNSDLEP